LTKDFPCDFRQRKGWEVTGNAAEYLLQDREAKKPFQAREDKELSLVDHDGQLAFKDIVRNCLIKLPQSVSVSF